MSKKSKSLHHDDPSAFSQRFPNIRQVDDIQSPLETMRSTRYYRMGGCRVVLSEPNEEHGWFMSVSRNDRYPSWDELVWLRYNLIPDAAIMQMRLPNLNSYINYERASAARNTFTMDQSGWAIDPMPEHCNTYMQLDIQTPSVLEFICPVCGERLSVDCNTWNEEHGNGFKQAVKS